MIYASSLREIVLRSVGETIASQRRPFWACVSYRQFTPATSVKKVFSMQGRWRPDLLHLFFAAAFEFIRHALRAGDFVSPSTCEQTLGKFVGVRTMPARGPSTSRRFKRISTIGFCSCQSKVLTLDAEVTKEKLMFRKMLVAVIAVLALSLSSRHAAACGRSGILIWACDGPSATSVGRVGLALGLSFSGASFGARGPHGYPFGAYGFDSRCIRNRRLVTPFGVRVWRVDICHEQLISFAPVPLYR
jgi:hypothetical protein